MDSSPETDGAEDAAHQVVPVRSEDSTERADLPQRYEWLLLRQRRTGCFRLQWGKPRQAYRDQERNHEQASHEAGPPGPAIPSPEPPAGCPEYARAEIVHQQVQRGGLGPVDQRSTA